MLEIPKMKYLKTFIISESKILRLFRKNEQYFIELIGEGYTVKFFAGMTLTEAKKRSIDVIKKIKAGGSVLEPFWL